MKKYSLIKTLPVFMAFYVMGFCDIVGFATNYAQRDLGLSSSLTQVLTMMAFVWFFILSIPVGVFQDRNGKKKTVIIGILFFAVSFLLPLVNYSFASMLGSFTLLGIGNAIIQVSTNPLMQDVSHPDALARNMTLSQFVKAIAGMLGPVIATFFALHTGNWWLVYLVYLVISLLTIVWLQFTKIEETGNTGRASFGSTLQLLRDRKVALLVVGTFVMVGFDVGMNTNIAKYLGASFQADQETSNLVITLYFAALAIGRFVSAGILGVVKGNRVLLFTALLAVASFALLYVMPGLMGGRIAVFCIGFFTAAIFPLIFSAGLQYMPERANELSGLMIMSVCGGGVIPPIVGVLTDAIGLMPALLLLAACLLYVVFLATYLIRTAKQ